MTHRVLEWQVADYCENILPKVMLHMDKDKGIVLDHDGEPLLEYQENKYIPGRTIFFNGNYVKHKVAQALENPEGLEHIVTHGVRTEREFKAYMKNEIKETDKIYIFNGNSNELSKFKGLLKISDSTQPNLQKEITERLPAEYVEIVQGTRKAGGRTIAEAVTTFRDYNVDGEDKRVESVGIHQTAGKYGFGLITHMANARVVEDVLPYFDVSKKCPQLQYRRMNASGQMDCIKNDAIDSWNLLLEFKYRPTQQNMIGEKESVVYA